MSEANSGLDFAGGEPTTRSYCATKPPSLFQIILVWSRWEPGSIDGEGGLATQSLPTDAEKYAY